MSGTQKEREPRIWGSCCGNPILANSSLIDDYVANFPVLGPCPACGKPLDWWSTVIGALEVNFFFRTELELAGARSNFLVPTLQRDQPLDIDFDTEGVPSDAQILAINITPQGPAYAAQVRQEYFVRDQIRNNLLLYPVVVGPLPADEVKLAMMVTWYRTGTDLAAEYLFDALHAFNEETRTDQLTHSTARWQRIIIPANLALELAVKRFVSDASKKLSFKIRKSNYDTALNKGLPTVAALLSVPVLPNHITKVINQLRTIRNYVVHQGAPQIPLNRREAATLVAAALFGFRYTGWVRQLKGI